MLTSKEKIGLKEIINSLDDEELFSLLETVTKRMFQTHNRSEAIETILSCTEKPTDLLRRQKVTKKNIFKYLIKKEKVLPDWEKNKLIQKCLELWESIESFEENSYIDEENKLTSNVSNCISEENDTNLILSPVLTSQMGLEFCRWFFKIYNALDGFGPEHFWPACNLDAELYNPLEQKQVSLSGASEVATFLANLITLDKYHFGANISNDAIMVEVEQHGLVKILAPGVLYQHSNCVGLFNFAFGLVKNPVAGYNYKIQVVKVNMQVNCANKGTLPESNRLPICQVPFTGVL